MEPQTWKGGKCYRRGRDREGGWIHSAEREQLVRALSMHSKGKPAKMKKKKNSLGRQKTGCLTFLALLGARPGGRRTQASPLHKAPAASPPALCGGEGLPRGRGRASPRASCHLPPATARLEPEAAALKRRWAWPRAAPGGACAEARPEPRPLQCGAPAQDRTLCHCGTLERGPSARPRGPAPSALRRRSAPHLPHCDTGSGGRRSPCLWRLRPARPAPLRQRPSLRRCTKAERRHPSPRTQPAFGRLIPKSFVPEAAKTNQGSHP